MHKYRSNANSETLQLFLNNIHDAFWFRLSVEFIILMVTTTAHFLLIACAYIDE